MRLYHEILACMKTFPEALYAGCPIEFSKAGRQYVSALVFAIPYGHRLPEPYCEEAFEHAIGKARETGEEMAYRLSALLETQGIGYYWPPVAQENEEELLAVFSFKHAAVQAGLGWIGKNGVLITHDYGPRVRLGAVLLENPLPPGKPITTSLCPSGCRLCVEACPSGCLPGTRWHPQALREDMIDYHACNYFRTGFFAKLGRKHACGYCLLACPVGRENNKTAGIKRA